MAKEAPGLGRLFGSLAEIGCIAIYVRILINEFGKTNSEDAMLVYSVGSDLERNDIPNIVAGLPEMKSSGTQILGIDGREGVSTKKIGDCVVVIPNVTAMRVTSHSEAFQAVVWHCLIAHSNPQQAASKW